MKIKIYTISFGTRKNKNNFSTKIPTGTNYDYDELRIASYKETYQIAKKEGFNKYIKN